MKIISFLAQKGGTGKTTTAANIGTCLTRQGFTVLFIDLDQQGNLADVLAPSETGKGTILNVLKGETDLQDAAVITEYGDLVFSDPEQYLYEPEPRDLANVIRTAADKYDYCIIDNPPQLTGWTAASIYAADYIVMPTQADVFGTKSITQLLNTVNTIRATTGHAGHVTGVLLTRYNGRTVLARQAREYLKKTAKDAGTALFSTDIRECNAIKEAQASGDDLYTYAPKSNAARDYRAVTTELLERINETEQQPTGHKEKRKTDREK